jgi:aspartate racemase
MKTVGILGGMGPAATVDLFDRIVQTTPARTDQEHLPILIVNDPNIPDRTQAILYGGPDPLPAMRHGLDMLVGMGAELLAMPCNTAHYYWPELQAGLDVPLVNMVDETVRAIRRSHPGIQQVGILATSSTLAVRLFQEVLEREGLEPVEPVEPEIV